MISVYVLSLENNKFYVGKTTDVAKRFSSHVQGNVRSAHWTRKHKPKSVIETFENADGLEEDRVTLMYMIRYGIDHVRGGPYVSCKLPESTRRHIIHRIRMATDLCGACGSPDHFMKDCTAAKTRAQNSVRCKACNSPHHFTEDCASV